MTYRDEVDADRRLCILRLLAEDPGYSHNDSVVQSALATLGHRVSREMVRADFAWLSQVGLVSVEEINATIHVAELTPRGLDVARGNATVPGVKRPGPRG